LKNLPRGKSGHSLEIQRIREPRQYSHIRARTSTLKFRKKWVSEPGRGLHHAFIKFGAVGFGCRKRYS
jgi:hypothetical protein